MATASKIADWAYKSFTAGLGVATVYLTATFSVNLYRGISWHLAQSKAEKEAMNNLNDDTDQEVLNKQETD